MPGKTFLKNWFLFYRRLHFSIKTAAIAPTYGGAILKHYYFSSELKINGFLHLNSITLDGVWTLVMGLDQNLRETSMNVNSCFAIFGNREIHECQFSQFFVILSEKFANFCVISREIAKITGIWCDGLSQFRTDVKRDSVKF